MSETTAIPVWHRSKKCGSNACVEVAKIGDTYLIRDSKDPDAQPLSVSTEEWTAFVDGVVNGDFDA